MPRRKLAGLLALVVLTSLGRGGAEVIIHLKDGGQQRLAIDPSEIRSIELVAPAAEPARRPTARPGEVLRVGPQHALKTPSAAAAVAVDGSVVEIDAGTYVGDVAIWPQNDLTLRGVGGLAHLRAAGRSAERKAIWVIRGDRVRIENMEFSGARVRDMNGAGIRFEGSHLTIRDSRFHDNQMGILTGFRPGSEIEIEGCEFARNMADPNADRPLGHNIYIGQIERFVLRASHIHDARIGHNVKSRARQNFILYNRIEDAEHGSSYLIDLATGGQAYVIGNVLRQGPDNDNNTLISFGPESADKADPGHALFVVNNTAVNDDRGGTLVQNHTASPARLVNNLYVGPGQLALGPNELAGNLQTDRPKLRDRRALDYRLTVRSPAVNRGRPPGESPHGVPLEPLQEYRHPLGLRPRPSVGAIDVGAYEFRAGQDRAQDAVTQEPHRSRTDGQ